MITGWSWTRRAELGYARPRTISYFIKVGLKPRQFEVTRGPLRFPHQLRTNAGRRTLLAMGNTDESMDLPARYEEFTRSAKDVGVTDLTIQAFLVDQIRAAAARVNYKSIGTDCMAIYLPINRGASTRITFVRDMQGHGAQEMSYSPWFIAANGMIMPPARMDSVGNSFVLGTEDDPYRVELSCDPPIPHRSGTHFLQSQPRREWPGHGPLLRQLNQQGATINYVTVAEAAGVSRSLLYRGPELRAERSTASANHAPTTTPRQPAAERISSAQCSSQRSEEVGRGGGSM